MSRPRRLPTKVGLAPGTLVHVGERREERPRITIFRYTAETLDERHDSTLQECRALRQAEGTVWIHVDGLHDTQLVESLGTCYGAHPLVMEDVLSTRQRPKVEDYGDYLFVVARMFRPETGVETAGEQFSLILGRNFVLSFLEATSDVFDPLRQRLRQGKGRLRSVGADDLAYSLLDALVDTFFSVAEQFGERIEQLEEELLDSPGQQTVAEIHTLKRQMILIRRAVWPLREVASVLERSDSDLVDAGTRVYLRDLYDHAVVLMEMIEGHRDALAGMLDVYLSSLSNRTNAIMKVLTMIATIFMPLSFLTGLYGMNFERMPGLASAWGFPAALAIMAAAAGGMLIYFKRKGWL